MEELIANLLDMTRAGGRGIQLKREWVPLEELIGSASDPNGRAPGETNGRGGHRLGRSARAGRSGTLRAGLRESAGKRRELHPRRRARLRSWHGARTAWSTSRFGTTALACPLGTEARVFEKFYRGPHSGTAGVGLGLPICRGIVEAHGGTIWAESRRAKRTTFRIAPESAGSSGRHSWSGRDSP